MYDILLQLHSITRWLVVLGLAVPLSGVWLALARPRLWTRFDTVAVEIGTKLAHVQLLVGMALYGASPLVHAFWSNPVAHAATPSTLFFGLIHIAAMFVAIVVVTVGSSKARRHPNDWNRFRLVAIYWTIAMAIILLSIPWPFSPLASRTLWRPI